MSESETSEVIRQRVQAARERQRIRFSNNGSFDIICNADMRIGEIRQFCQLQDEGGALSVSKCQSLMRAFGRGTAISPKDYAQHHMME
jgi:predicted ATPase with chaperone activity